MVIVTVAALQFACVNDINVNIVRAESLVRKAAKLGAKIILLQELFSGLYFCQVQNMEYLDWSEEESSSKLISHFSLLV
jgi:N-carbamoylputrescine amidase